MMAAMQPSGISNQTDFMYFCLHMYKLSSYFLPSLETTGLSVKKKKFNKDLQDGGCVGYLGFPIRTILTVFDLQVTPIHHTKFSVNWPFG